jgi:hypothetical protein
MIQRQAIQLKRAVEIPSSGSARVNDDRIATTEIAAANKNGTNFFISDFFNEFDTPSQKSNQIEGGRLVYHQYFFILTFLPK